MVIRRPSGCTALFAPPSLLAVLCVVVLLAAGCSSDDDLGAGDAATVADGFTAEYSADGAEWTEAAAGAVIPADVQVRSTDGELRLTFRDGEVRLSPDAVATVSAQRVTLQRGQALVDSKGPLGAGLDDTTVAGAGHYRLAGGLAARLGVYAGEVEVTRPAQEQRVAARRQLDLSAFRFETPTPLQYRDADPWDRELLAEAIAFDGEAARLSTGMDSQLGTRARPSAFYRRFAPHNGALTLLTAMAANVRDGRFGPPSDVLLPLFVAQAAPGTFDDAVTAVADLRAGGARWGLVAVELDVASDRVVAAIDALGDDQLAADDGTGSQAAAAAGSPDSAGVRTAAVDEDSSGVRSTDAGVNNSATGGDDTNSTGTGSSDDGDSGKDGSQDPGGTDPPDNPPKSPPGDDPDPPDEKPDPPDEPESPVDTVVNEVVKAVDKDGNLDESGIEPVTKPIEDLLDGDS